MEWLVRCRKWKLMYRCMRVCMVSKNLPEKGIIMQGNGYLWPHLILTLDFTWDAIMRRLFSNRQPLVVAEYVRTFADSKGLNYKNPSCSELIFNIIGRQIVLVDVYKWRYIYQCKFGSVNKKNRGISVCKSSATSTSASLLSFRDLDADDFRHPLDKQNTLLLRAIPGLNEIGKALLGSIAEQVMVLENIGTSVLVSENQLSELHQLMVQSAEALKIEAPDLYVRQSPVPNAYTLAINGKKPFVVVHTSLIELLTRKELQAVLAHELGHLKCDHGVWLVKFLQGIIRPTWLTVANILTVGAYTIPGSNNMNNQTLLFQNPLFSHPSDGPGTLVIGEKLIGAQKYRSWRRSVEIALSTKRKLGFIRGTVPRSLDDVNLQEQWDTCNNLVISWLMNSVSESIAKSIMFMGTAHAIWLQLETRFALSKPVSEYYTSMKCVWEELDSMNELPRIVNITPEIAVFLNALNTQKEEQRLFQFLNGLDDHFASQRSQLPLNTPLPSVETTCALLQQEEFQRGVFGGGTQLGVESTALYSKGETKEKCDICGFKWHPPDKCWEKVGYPTWHYKYKQNQKGKSVQRNGTGNIKRNANAVMVEDVGHVVFTSKQFEQLMKSLPHFNQPTNTDMEHPFGEGTSYCFSCVNGIVEGWIIDTGASDHMSPDSDEFDNVALLKTKQLINLPNGHTSVISKVGNVTLQNNIALKNVLVLSSMVVSALEDCSLYSFFSNCSVPDTFAFSVFNNSYSLWHHRLGHVSNSTLKHIPSVSKHISNASSDSCLTCRMAKFA
ncbi:peptidase family M48 family protein [Artemisia annua]|uniref:Peptidase family M48 family protein n=1 Tax=Artemisia annua TaxID=35608 RepID=A0A2U1KHW9_ARTAN|nr:peptidase family M48 family protein [Artemisia annua]